MQIRLNNPHLQTNNKQKAIKQENCPGYHFLSCHLSVCSPAALRCFPDTTSSSFSISFTISLLSLLPGSSIPVSNCWKPQGSFILGSILFITQRKTFSEMISLKPRAATTIGRLHDAHICVSTPLANWLAGFVPPPLGCLIGDSNFIGLKQTLHPYPPPWQIITGSTLAHLSIGTTIRKIPQDGQSGGSSYSHLSLMHQR